MLFSSEQIKHQDWRPLSEPEIRLGLRAVPMTVKSASDQLSRLSRDARQMDVKCNILRLNVDQVYVCIREGN